MGLHTCAREDEIPHAGQTPHGEGVCARSYSQASHLSEAPGDERRSGIAAELEPIADAARNGEHVLERAAQLDSCAGLVDGLVVSGASCVETG